MNRRIVTIVLLLMSIAGPTCWVAAQSVILSGNVTDAATGKPLPFANVYLNGTTRGTTTDAQGQFDLPNVPLGTVEIVASFLGFQPVRQTLRLDQASPQRLLFRLQPDNRMLAGVTVKARSKDRQWQRQFRQFRRQLLGTPFGDKCVITNSFSLSFTEQGGHLKATASEPLAIENQALGYRVFYDLQYFDGSFRKVYYGGTGRFEELPAADAQQAERYRRNRMRAYRGSLRHMLTTLINGTHEKEGFLIYYEDLTKPIANEGGVPNLADAVRLHKRLIPINADTLIRPGKLSFERRLEAIRPITIFYTRAISAFSPYRDARYAYSQLTLPMGWMQLTTEGWITSPNGMEVTGSLADDRLSTLLPADWSPTDQVQPIGPDREKDSLNRSLAPVVAQGQLKPLDARSRRIADAFTQQFQNLSPTVFVHIDKPLYATGDHLWLSAYLLDAATNRTPIGETAIQVDLLTPSGRLVQHQWLYMTDGRAVGRFRLSDTLSSGRYRLRGYTDEDDRQRRPAFERSVLVYNWLQKSADSSVAKPAKLASQRTAPIVQIDSGRLTVAVDIVTDTNRLLIRIDGDNRQSLDSAYMLVQQRGQVIDQHKVILEKGMALFSLPLLTMPPGLTQLRLYDASARLQAERLVYIPDRLPPVQVLLTTNKPLYQPREMVTLLLNLTDDGQPVVGALSASITDADQVLADTAVADIQAHLQVMGDLGDQIKNPAVYAGGGRPDGRRALNNRLQTGTWRRVGGATETDALGGVSVMGRILNPANHPMPGAQIMLASTTTGQSFMRSAGADEQGRFRVAGLAIADTLPVLVQLTDQNFKNLSTDKARFVLERIGENWSRTDSDTNVNWTAVSAQLLAAQHRQEAQPDVYRDKSARQLREVTVRARKQPDVPDRLQRTRLHSEADHTLILDGRASQFANLFELIRGQVPGVTVTFKDGYYSVVVRGISTFTSGSAPLFLIDGMPSDYDMVLNLPVSEVDRIEVLKNAASAGIYGVRAANGVIAIYTKITGTNSSRTVSKNASQTIRLIGYPAKPPVFSLPRYESDAPPVAENAPVDRRDVLYWKPIVQTDADGRAQVMFPLSDVVRTIRVTVQGITQDGRPVSATKLIRVQ